MPTSYMNCVYYAYCKEISYNNKRTKELHLHVFLLSVVLSHLENEKLKSAIYFKSSKTLLCFQIGFFILLSKIEDIILFDSPDMLSWIKLSW